MTLIYTNQSSGRKRKQKKSQRVIEAERKLQETLQRVGYKGNGVKKRSYKSDYVRPVSVTSDVIPTNGNRKEQLRYTGDEIMGIALNHKSNYEPIRKDNKKAAIDSAQMRRS